MVTRSGRAQRRGVDGDTIWSRTAAGRFPAMKELKQLVRDRVAPERSLGHSDPPIGA